MADLAEALGVQKGSLYSLTESKQALLVVVTREGAAAFHAALDGVPDDAEPLERVRLALRAHLAVVAGQLDVAAVFTREWRFLDEPERTAFRSSAPPLRGALARPRSATPPSAARSAPTSTWRRPCSSSSRRPTGPTPGSARTPTRTRSPTASGGWWSTGCAATRPARGAA